MALDVSTDEFDKKMALLRNTMRAAVDADTRQLQWLLGLNDEEARQRYERKMKVLDSVFGPPPVDRQK